MFPNNVLRIHYKFTLQEGAEYEMLKSMDAMFVHIGTEKHLVPVAKEGGQYLVGPYDSEKDRRTVNIGGVRSYLKQYVEDHGIGVINIHSMPYPEVTEVVLSLGIPVVRSLHESMISCPGWSRFLAQSGTPCTKNFGPLCLVRAYTEKCQRSRNPRNLFAAYYNVFREQRDFIPRYSYLLVYSDYMAGILRQHGVPEEKIMKIPSPQMADTDKITMAPKTGIPRLVFAGRVSKQKGILDLLQAYRKLVNDHGLELSLDVAGNGELVDELRNQTSREGLGEARFLGWCQREEMWNLFASDCIVVIPSIYPDNFPNVVAEAMLCGAPVVASNAGGTSEWFNDGESGLSYDSGNIPQLVERILMLVRSPELRERMGLAGRQCIQDSHTAKIAAERYAEIYRLAIGAQTSKESKHP